ncbi:MAG: transposase [Patescibacteria group bacterium]
MELYHLLNRGVDKRKIFLDNQDQARFVHDLYEFNDSASATNTVRGLPPDSPEAIMFDLVGRTSERDPIVDIHGWCIMGNHYHLLVSEIVDGGITKFIMKLNVGYAKYFNARYKRVGTLFQGRTKKIHINSDAYFLHILHYIHLNPLDFLRGAESWRTLEIKKAKDALAYLDTYRWSSYLDYCGKKNFPSIITKELFGDIFKNYGQKIASYLKDIEINDIRPFLLE